MALNQISFKAKPEELVSLERFIEENDYHWEQHSAPGVKKRSISQDCVVTLYHSGTVLVQGKGTAELIRQVWPHRALEQPIQSDLPATYIGADESGKGDYFGPLVVAAVLVNPTITERLKQLGVRDSKRLSERQVQEVSLEIEEQCCCRVRVVEPQEYNRLYACYGNLNHLLARLHQETISGLLGECSAAQVIIDQFAVDSTMRHKIDLPGTNVRFFPRAESKAIGVAAASIIARNYFLAGLKALGHLYGTELPKGAVQVVEAGRKLVQKHGPQVLSWTAKLHFKTTDKILAVSARTGSCTKSELV